MSELTEFSADANEKENTDFYLPATAVSPNVEYIGKVVGDVLNFHGVVLIPDTYDK